MGTFRAAAIETIRWDFRPQGGQKVPTIDPETGTVNGWFTNSDPLAVGGLPEPTDQQVQTFLNDYRDILRSAVNAGVQADIAAELAAEGEDDADTDDVEPAAAAAEPEAPVEYDPDSIMLDTREKLQDAMVAVGVPEELLVRLPLRWFRALVQHVHRELSGNAGPVA